MFNVLLVALAVTIPSVPSNRISDGAGLLSTPEMIQLENLFQETQRTQGVNLGLLTVNTLDDDPKAVSVRTLNFWQMSPDSVLILVSLNPRKVYLQPGSNLATKFHEGLATDIVRKDMVPSLRAGRTGDAILNGFRSVIRTLGVPTPAPSVVQPSVPQPTHEVDTQPVAPPERNAGTFFLVLLSLVALGVGAWAVMGYLESRRKRRGARAEYSPTYEPIRTTTRRPVNVVQSSPAPVTVVQTGGSNDFLTGMAVNEMLHDHHDHVPAAAPVAPSAPAYVPPPAPTPPEPSRSSVWDSVSDALSSGGGGSDWGSSDSGSSSDSGGGGGSDW